MSSFSWSSSVGGKIEAYVQAATEDACPSRTEFFICDATLSHLRKALAILYGRHLIYYMTKTEVCAEPNFFLSSKIMQFRLCLLGWNSMFIKELTGCVWELITACCGSSSPSRSLILGFFCHWLQSRHTSNLAFCSLGFEVDQFLINVYQNSESFAPGMIPVIFSPSSYRC